MAIRVKKNGTYVTGSVKVKRAGTYVAGSVFEKVAGAYVSVELGDAPVDLEHVVILGASHEVNAWGQALDNNSTLVQGVRARITAATGKVVQFHQYAVAGSTTEQMLTTDMENMLTAQAALPGNGKTAVLIGIGGNDVTLGRPFPANSAALTDLRGKVLQAIAKIEAKGWDWCLFDLTWRDYDPPLCRTDRGQGSWAWVEQVSRVINATRNRLYGRRWTYENGASWCDTYSFVRNNRQLVAGDGIHLTSYVAYSDFVIDAAVIPAVTGVPVPQIFPRDETYPLAYSIGVPTVDGTSVTVPTTATHQGVAHVAAYVAGSTPTAAEVVAGNGAGFISKVSATRLGSIDAPVSQVVNGLMGTTNYRMCSVFVSDAGQTSAVVSADVTTGGSSLGPSATVFIFRGTGAGAVSTRPNLNQLISAPTLTGGVKTTNAINLDGESTGIGFNVTTAFSSVNEAGNAALNVPDYFLAGELNNSWYLDGTKSATVVLTGLNPAKTYTLVAAGTRNVASTETNRVGEFTITAGTPLPAAMQTLNAANPATGTTAGHVIFTVTPTAGGQVSFNYSRNAATGFAYLSGLYLKPV